MTRAVAYYRTSSKSGIGDDKDSRARQQDAVSKYAERNGITIVSEFYDVICGEDNVLDRPEFSKMLAFLARSDVKIVLVETANRFARDLVVQLTGHQILKDAGVSLIPVDIPDHFTNETPTAVMVRQILGAVSQFEKASLVQKLRRGQERKRQQCGRCGGRKPPPRDHIETARSMSKADLSLRGISATMAALGMLGPSGKPYGPESIKRMIQ